MSINPKYDGRFSESAKLMTTVSVGDRTGYNDRYESDMRFLCRTRMGHILNKFALANFTRRDVRIRVKSGDISVRMYLDECKGNGIEPASRCRGIPISFQDADEIVLS